jgi:uncharacterized damage-inducible protein DinB
MPETLQTFLASATQKAAADLETALMRVPEDKRTWSPMDKARSAMDQAAEVAMLNGYTAHLINNRSWDTKFDFDDYLQEKAALAQDWNAVKALLDKNTPLVIAAIQAVPDSDLDIEVTLPWGPSSLAQVMSYPYWNMSYHEGQINYIASMLGCLD